MELPSTRELELEIQLRERDAQVAELTDEITVLRKYLAKQPGPSTTEPVTLPHSLVSIILPHLKYTSPTSGSSTVTAALTQRARLLQEENDELYELLKTSETGKLTDEVRGLRRVVANLEGALQGSHQIISSLQTELDKTYQTLMNSSRQISSSNNAKSHSRSPRNTFHPSLRPEYGSNGSSQSKMLPTAPRAHKKPRLSEPQTSPPARPAPQLPHKPQNHSHSHSGLPSRPDTRDASRHGADNRAKSNSNVKMEVDDDDLARAPSPATRERDRVRDRERNRERGAKDRERERERGRDWERDGKQNPISRRNGNHGGPVGGRGGGSGRKGTERNHGTGSANNIPDNSSRTLQERLGL